MRIRRLIPMIIPFLGVVGCAPTEISSPSLSNLPVYHDPRPMYVLFSWTHHGAFRYALISDPEHGIQRNRFLDAYHEQRVEGVDLSSLESSLRSLPASSVVEWWIEDRRFFLPPPSVVRHIQRLIAQRKATLRFDDVNTWMAFDERAYTKPAQA
jgi:hypothetical protein